MLSKALISGVLLLAVAAPQPASPGRTAADRLSKVSVFAIGGVGFAGKTSEGEEDFRVVLQDPGATKLFEGLYDHGNHQAKAYALLGLHTLQPQRFREISTTLPDSGAEVSTMQGCIASRKKLKAVAQEIEAGVFFVTRSQR